jgi:hypothetical protein
MNLNVHLGSNVTTVNTRLDRSLDPTFLSNTAGPIPQQNASVHGATGTVDVSAPPDEIVASGPDATRVDGREALPAPPPSLNSVINATTVLMTVLWVLTLALPPVVVLTLPVTAQSIIAGYVAAVGLMLMIHWRVTDKGKDD